MSLSLSYKCRLHFLTEDVNDINSRRHWLASCVIELLCYHHHVISLSSRSINITTNKLLPTGSILNGQLFKFQPEIERWKFIGIQGSRHPRYMLIMNYAMSATYLYYLYTIHRHFTWSAHLIYSIGNRSRISRMAEFGTLHHYSYVVQSIFPYFSKLFIIV